MARKGWENMNAEEREESNRRINEDIQRFQDTQRLIEQAHPRPGRLSLEEIRASSSDELLSYLARGGNHRGTFDHNTAAAINAELTHRATRPHWTLMPSFRLLVASTVLAGLSALLAVLALPFVQPHLPWSGDQPPTPSRPASSVPTSPPPAG